MVSEHKISWRKLQENLSFAYFDVHVIFRASFLLVLDGLPAAEVKGKFGLATEAEYWWIYCIIILCLLDQWTCYLKLVYHDTNKSFQSPIVSSSVRRAVSSMPLKISCSRKQCCPWLSVTCDGHFCRHNTRIESIWLVSVHHELRHSAVLYTLYIAVFWLSPSQTLNNTCRFTFTFIENCLYRNVNCDHLALRHDV